MKKKYFSSLWARFVGVTILVLIGIMLSMSLIVFLFFHFGLLKVEQRNPLWPVVILLIIGSMVGAVLFLFVGKTFIKPIKSFSVASKEVAKGDFKVRINDTSKIEEVQEMANNFNVMVQELGSIETLRSDFVANVSHEFKTPLAAIEGYATLLQEKGLSDTDRDEYVRMIIDSVRQLSTLTGNILSLSKLENQEIFLEKSVFRLDEQIRESIVLLENYWNEKNIELLIDLNKVKYLGDKSLLRHVWLNLIDNAIKFTPINGKINISLIEENAKITVKIKDNGKGMEASEIKHIFDKFYQSDKSRKENGNGLGLALVKRIVDLCEGTVAVESSPGNGSEFIVSFPVNF